MSKFIPQFKFKVEPEDFGKRLDLFLCKKLPQFTRSKIQKSIVQGLALVDDRLERSSYRVGAGQTVFFSLIEELPQKFESQSIPLKIIFEGSDFLVIDKPAGMVVHPGAGNRNGTLLNAILGHLGSKGAERAGIAHRLDRETSGLLVVAKNESVFQDLQSQFKNRSVSKKYLALVWGKLSESQARIDLPIGRSHTDRKKMAVLEKGKIAETIYRLKKEYKLEGQTVSLLEVFPKTGRTHQIRVHLAAIGHPVVGDKTYGYKRGPDKALNRQFLHAFYLKFREPGKENWLEFKVDLPVELDQFLKKLSQ